MPSFVDRAKGRVAELRQHHPRFDHAVLTQEHYGATKSSQQAGAVTYFGFLSVFPVLALAFFVVGWVSQVFPDAQFARIEEHLTVAAGATARFPVHLRGTGTFRPVSPVVFVSLVEGISRCEQLAAAVRTGPLAVDLAFPYHPHVTVAHHLSDAQLDQAFDELADFECEFDVADFKLYVHDEDLGWRPTRYFALQPGT